MSCRLSQWTVNSVFQLSNTKKDQRDDDDNRVFDVSYQNCFPDGKMETQKEEHQA